MNNLQQQYEQAQSAYASARDSLDIARSAYENGAGKAFDEAKANRETIASNLDAQKHASERAKTALSEAMRQSSGERTQDVSQALTARRDADDLIEQFSELLSESDRLLSTAHVDASEAARKYVQAYETAAQRWAEMNLLAALVECGARIAAAMAVKAPHDTLVPYSVRYEAGTAGSQVQSCEQIAITALRDLASQCDEKAYRQELGSVDIKALTSQILSPAKTHQARQAAKAC